MRTDQHTLVRLRDQARQARAAGHYRQAARLERQAVELAEALGLRGERTRALLWEGYSLRQVGEDDLALAALLQAANERAASADPADVFSALVAILHISLERKTVAFCRALLEQGRRYLADLRQPWGTLLDFLEGELAFRRGDFAAAWEWHSRAWAGRREEHPRLTPATHCWALCRVAFRRCDLVELERWVERLAELQPTQALERQLAQRAQLLLWRARRAAEANSAVIPAPVESAQALLAGEGDGDGENQDSGAQREALRVLALGGCWEEVDAALSRQSLQADSFENALLLGDLALNRALLALGLAAVDLDYGERGANVSTPALVALDEAKQHYQAVKEWIEIEDERLETNWYSDMLQKRLNIFT